MGWFKRLFKRDAVGVSPAIAELVRHPPRLVNEGPEFPRAPIVLGRIVEAIHVEHALSQAGFLRTNDTIWERSGTVVEPRAEHGVCVLVFRGEGVVDAQRELLATLPWIKPAR